MKEELSQASRIVRTCAERSFMTLAEILPLAAVAVAFWLLLIRPASVRRKAQARLVASLAPGQAIMTTAGVFGTVVAIDGERVRIEVAPGVVIEMLAQAIAQAIPAAPEDVADARDGIAAASDSEDVPGPVQEADRG
jgi:preprotein translocase subunit YajC